MEQLKMFEMEPVPAIPPRLASRPRVDVVYGKYRPKNPVKCDDCVLLLAQMDGLAPLARYARHFRKTANGGGRRLLCTSHMSQWRERDKLPKRKDWK